VKREINKRLVRYCTESQYPTSSLVSGLQMYSMGLEETNKKNIINMTRIYLPQMEKAIEHAKPNVQRRH
jgi:hypothetical protein